MKTDEGHRDRRGRVGAPHRRGAPPPRPRRHADRPPRRRQLVVLLPGTDPNVARRRPRTPAGTPGDTRGRRDAAVQRTVAVHGLPATRGALARRRVVAESHLYAGGLWHRL